MELSILVFNFTYALIGAFFTLAFMALGYMLFDRMTPFDTGVELQKGNISVGIVVGAIFIGVGVAIGLVIGMGLN
tara:strand:- start:471 stop:695 length:225 start_codon:yes stop_codon:yes gene_type:complete